MEPYAKAKATTLGTMLHLRTWAGDGYETESYTFGKYVLNDMLTGYRNPKWRELVARGQQAGTHMTASSKHLKLIEADATIETTYGKWNVAKAPYFFTLTGTVRGNYAVPFQDLQPGRMSSAKADAQALSRLYQALRNQRTSMQAGVTLGELKQSVKGISDISLSLARNFGSHVKQQRKLLVRHIGSFVVGPTGSPVRDPSVVRRAKRLPASTREKLFHELREGYLQFALGLRPLVKDVKDLAQTVARWQFDYNHTQVRGYGKDVSQHFVRSDKTTGPGGAYSVSDTVKTTTRFETVEVIYRAGLATDWTSPAFGSAHRLYQLLGAYDLENWIPTIWNLLPWSFVVDYVTNVADVVTAMVTDTSNVNWVVKTLRREVNEVVEIPVPYRRIYAGYVGSAPNGHHSYKTQHGTLGGYYQTTRDVIRTPQAGIALPTLTFNLPRDSGLTIPNLIALFSGSNPNRNYSRGD